jgi:hypothetical protein
MLPPPFTRYRIELRLHHAARLHFRHEVMLHSLLSEALGRGELPESVVPFACESGRVEIGRDEGYRIGFTITGDRATSEQRTATSEPRTANGDDFAEHFARALSVYGARGFQGENIPMLRWFGVGKPERLPGPDLDAECAALAGREELELRFVSPLRLEVPRGSRSETPHFFDAARFPAGDFLRLLWNRLFFLAEGRFPHREEVEGGLPPIPELTADPRQLLWLDIPRTTKPALGGVVGKLVLRNPGPAWLPLLVAGQYLHVGKSCGYGFGAYRIVNGTPLCNDPFGPSRTALERVADRERLMAATSHVAAATEAGGTDGIGPKEFVRRQEELVTATIRALADGSYKPAPLLGILLPKGHHKVRVLAVPTLTDRAVQRAALEVIGPAVETLFEDCSPASRNGSALARGVAPAEQADADSGRRQTDDDIDSLLDAIDWERLFGKLEALFPFDPIVAVIREWVTAPLILDGRLVRRTHGLPRGAEISTLLAQLWLGEL